MRNRSPSSDVRFGTPHDGQDAEGLIWIQGLRSHGMGLIVASTVFWCCWAWVLSVPPPRFVHALRAHLAVSVQHIS
jgi:hypothetical protein